PGAAGGAGQRSDQVAVELDDGQRAMTLEQRQGQRALAGADLDQPVLRARCDRVDDTLDIGLLVQEVLPERFLGAAETARGWCAHAGAPSASAWRRAAASCAQVPMAAIRLVGSARPVPARSSAVPWSPATRGQGRPRVRFTACSKPLYLSTGRPWSWYMANTASTSRRRCGRNAVSAGSGPCRRMPCARSRSRSGLITPTS